MKRILQFLRATLAGGILFLLPIILLVVLLNKALGFTQKVVTPLASEISIKSVIGVHLSMLLAVGLIVLFCFLAGVFSRTAFARRIVRLLEEGLLSNLPGYEFLKGVGASQLGVEQNEIQQVVLARFDDAWQVGFLTERLDNGMVAVFVPGAPDPRSGAVYFMTADRITPTEIKPAAMMKCLKRLGVGSKASLDQLFAGETAPNHPAKPAMRDL